MLIVQGRVGKAPLFACYAMVKEACWAAAGAEEEVKESLAVRGADCQRTTVREP